jgi:hypothetical protein
MDNGPNIKRKNVEGDKTLNEKQRLGQTVEDKNLPLGPNVEK